MRDIPTLISIHALREEGDPGSCQPLVDWGTFLSTPSARRATRQTQTVAQASSYFYPRPPRGGRPPQLDQSYLASSISIHALREEGDQILQRDDGVVCTISIHALREEGDAKWIADNPDAYKFLSTPSARRATIPAITSASSSGISIHALREEGDCYSSVEGR